MTSRAIYEIKKVYNAGFKIQISEKKINTEFTVTGRIREALACVHSGVTLLHEKGLGSPSGWPHCLGVYTWFVALTSFFLAGKPCPSFTLSLKCHYFSGAGHIIFLCKFNFFLSQ